MNRTKIKYILFTAVGGAILGGLVWYFNTCNGGECARTQWPAAWIGGGALMGFFIGWDDQKTGKNDSI
jgi:hypothetical protein